MLALSARIHRANQRRSARPAASLLDELRSKVELTVATTPVVHRLDAAAIERARRHMKGGGTLDEACALAEPRFREMDDFMQQVFRQAIEASVKTPR